MSNEPVPVGFVGLGAMGAAIARNLHAAGHPVVAYNRTRATAERFASDVSGASVAATPAEAAATGIVFTMLADDAALEATTFGGDGIASGLPPGGLHVSLSTISVALSTRLAAEHRARGTHFVAAPVFGRPDAAAAKKLFVVAAGEAAALERARPLFEAIGQRTYEIGNDPPQATLVKLTGNFLITCVIESLSEALVLGEKGGIAPAALLDLLTGTLFGAPVYKTYGNLIVENAFLPAGFKVPLGQKDNRLVREAATALATPLPFAEVVRERFERAIDAGQADLDWSSIARVTARDAGLDPERA